MIYKEITYKKSKIDIEFFRINIMIKNSKQGSTYKNIIKNYNFMFNEIESTYGYFFCNVEKLLQGDSYKELYLGLNHPLTLIILLFMIKIYNNNYKIFSIKDLYLKEKYNNIDDFVAYCSNEDRIEEILYNYNLLKEYKNFKKKYL